ncbi:MAG: hypothetical protein KGJ96_06465, partial [Xanthomonadaceae bacterium]|nr:hypothetical protein [Xanthomonadaceae bacterium]
ASRVNSANGDSDTREVVCAFRVPAFGAELLFEHDVVTSATSRMNTDKYRTDMIPLPPMEVTQAHVSRSSLRPGAIYSQVHP